MKKLFYLLILLAPVLLQAQSYDTLYLGHARTVTKVRGKLFNDSVTYYKDLSAGTYLRSYASNGLLYFNGAPIASQSYVNSQIAAIPSGATYGAGYGLKLVSNTFILDTSYGHKYFTYGFLVPNDSTVLADTTAGATKLSTQGYVSRAIAAISSTGGVSLTADQTFTGSNIFSATVTASAAGGTPKSIQGLYSTPTLTASNANDTLAGYRSAMTANINGQTNVQRYSFKGDKFDALLNGVIVGTGNNTQVSNGNTSLGFRAGNSLTSGTSNTSIGYEAGRSLTTQYNNTMVGYQAGISITTGTDNTLMGAASGFGSAAARTRNTLIGSVAGYGITGDDNVGVGASAARVAGNRNVAIGTNAGYTGNTGDDNVLIGYRASANFSTSGKYVLANAGSFPGNNILQYGDFTTGQMLFGAGDVAAAPSLNASALVEIKSTTRGLLLPRMTKAQRDAISTPLAGLAVYQTDNTPGLRVYNGTNWIKYSETTD